MIGEDGIVGRIREVAAGMDREAGRIVRGLGIGPGHGTDRGRRSVGPVRRVAATEDVLIAAVAVVAANPDAAANVAAHRLEMTAVAATVTTVATATEEVAGTTTPAGTAHRRPVVGLHHVAEIVSRHRRRISSSCSSNRWRRSSRCNSRDRQFRGSMIEE